MGVIESLKGLLVQGSYGVRHSVDTLSQPRCVEGSHKVRPIGRVSLLVSLKRNPGGRMFKNTGTPTSRWPRFFA